MKNTIYILLLSFIFGCKSENKNKTSLISENTIAENIEKVTVNKYDELIGLYSTVENGKADVKISKSGNKYYYSQLGKKGETEKTELKPIESSDIAKMFKDNNTSEYFKIGLQAGSGGIAKVKKGYELKKWTTFKTEFILLPFGNDLFKK